MPVDRVFMKVNVNIAIPILTAPTAINTRRLVLLLFCPNLVTAASAHAIISCGGSSTDTESKYPRRNERDVCVFNVTSL